MELVIDRKWKKDEYTISNLYVDGSKVCNVIEDKDRGLDQNMPLDEIKKLKVYGKTAIPTGRYKVVFAASNRFGNSSYAMNKLIPYVQNVKGFSDIRMHAGNTDKDTEGCLLLGKNDVVGKVTNSQYWCKKVFERMYLAWCNGATIWLTVK